MAALLTDKDAKKVSFAMKSPSKLSDRLKDAILIVLVIMVIVRLPAECAFPGPSYPSPKTNAWPCLISVNKVPGGNVKLSVYNVKGPEVVVLRRYDAGGGLKFEVSDGKGGWGPLEHVNPLLKFDLPGTSDDDWVCLSQGEEASWYIYYNYVGRLRVGEKVKLHWETDDSVPSFLTRFGAPFPYPSVDIVLTVQAEPGS